MASRQSGVYNRGPGRGSSRRSPRKSSIFTPWTTSSWISSYRTPTRRTSIPWTPWTWTAFSWTPWTWTAISWTSRAAISRTTPTRLPCSRLLPSRLSSRLSTTPRPRISRPTWYCSSPNSSGPSSTMATARAGRP